MERKIKLIMKKIAIFLTVLILSKFVMANPYTPGSQSWHNWNAMAQSEADKRNAERNRQENIRRQKEAESRQREYYKNRPLYKAFAKYGLNNFEFCAKPMPC